MVIHFRPLPVDEQKQNHTHSNNYLKFYNWPPFFVQCPLFEVKLSFLTKLGLLAAIRSKITSNWLYRTLYWTNPGPSCCNLFDVDSTRYTTKKGLLTPFFDQEKEIGVASFKTETTTATISTLVVNRLEEASKLLYLLLSLYIRLWTHMVDYRKIK